MSPHGTAHRVSPRGLFVTGTDTGVGKTAVACALVRALRAKGLDAGALKPVASGARRVGRRLVAEDAVRLRAAAGNADPLELVCPIVYREPLAPAVAAARARRPFDLRRVLSAYRELAARHDFLVVEGVGGLLVPLADDLLVLDLARRLGLPLLVVARWRLGTLNHTLLTVRAAEAAGLSVLGIVLNETEPGRHGPAEKTVAPVLEKLTGRPILARLPFVPGGAVAQERALARRLGRGLDALGQKLAVLPSERHGRARRGHRELRLQDFAERKRYDPLNVFRLEREIEYIPVHPFADDPPEFFRRLRYHPERCTGVDGYVRLHEDVFFLEVLAKPDELGQNRRKYYIWYSDGAPPLVKLFCHVGADVITRKDFAMAIRKAVILRRRGLLWSVRHRRLRLI